MRIDGKPWLQALICFVGIAASGNAGPFLFAQKHEATSDQAVKKPTPEKPAENCQPCQTVALAMKKAKLDAPQEGFREPDELSLQDVKKALAAGDACARTALLPEGEKEAPHCGLRLKEVQAFLPKLQAVEFRIESALRKQNQLSAALQALAAFKTLPPDGRSGLPPQDPCQQCNEIWDNMKGVMVFASSGEKRFLRKIENGKAVAEANELYMQAAHDLCPHKDKILDSHVTTERLAYYNWTQTFSTYTKLKDALQSRAVIAFCP